MDEQSFYIENRDNMFFIVGEVKDVTPKELDDALDLIIKSDDEEQLGLEQTFSEEEVSEAMKVCQQHIFYKYFKIGKTLFTEDEAVEEFNKLHLSRTLEKLVKDGLLDASFDEKGEVIYQLTEEGKKYTPSSQ